MSTGISDFSTRLFAEAHLANDPGNDVGFNIDKIWWDDSAGSIKICVGDVVSRWRGRTRYRRAEIPLLLVTPEDRIPPGELPRLLCVEVIEVEEMKSMSGEEVLNVSKQRLPFIQFLEFNFCEDDVNLIYE